MNRKALLVVAVVGVALVCLVGVAAVYLLSPLVVDQTVEEGLPGADELGAMPLEELDAIEEEMMATAAAMPDMEMDEEMPGGEPVALRQGQFQDADSFHQGEGTATVYELGDGRRVLRFESFMVTNGPDLHVLLATGTAADRDSLGEYVDLGELKGNIGSQNYDIPAGTDLAAYGTVVIYCLPFHVVFATAPLAE